MLGFAQVGLGPGQHSLGSGNGFAARPGLDQGSIGAALIGTGQRSASQPGARLAGNFEQDLPGPHHIAPPDQHPGDHTVGCGDQLARFPRAVDPANCGGKIG